MDAGGTQFSADKGRIYVVYPNGLAQPVKNSVWRGSNVAVPPGTTVIVPKNLDPLFKLELVQNIVGIVRSEEHTSELQSLLRISYAVFCLKKKKKRQQVTLHV